MAPCAMDSLAMEGAVHSHSDFRVRRSVVHRALNWLVTHNQYCRSNHVHIDVNPLQQLPHDGNLSTSLPSLLRTPSLNLLPPTLLQLVLLSPRGPPLPKRAYEISNLPKDFRFQPIQQKISRFQQRFQISADSAKDFKISVKISRFHRRFQISRGFLLRFQDFSRDFMVVRGRPIARARSVVPVPVRPSATLRVPECVCVNMLA